MIFDLIDLKLTVLAYPSSSPYFRPFDLLVIRI